ncbi:Rieske (2Fe-2S) protein [Pseudanabaena sp. UWO310]|uniref:Rieske (2Fe-2S) protein n=1 Tax=Pseudanabaena sp. UWO310 TaxID=2480795 RepID=UPI00115A4D26|nr:Rieske (2Fe-2S) protein [Pseudanabaena sp. UWO310]TYQ31198.1 Rieske (2Fe-2S) protein [Pseudanabaena sp. UWO310]
MNQQPTSTTKISEMDKNDFYSHPIYINQLKPEVINFIDIGEGLQVIVIKQEHEISIISDICPHMGGYVSQGKYCAKSQTLQCPWHGYIFDLATGVFKENPNEVIWDKLRYPTEHFKPNTTPKYKLNKLEYEIDQDKIYIRRQPKSGIPKSAI